LLLGLLRCVKRVHISIIAQYHFLKHILWALIVVSEVLRHMDMRQTRFISDLVRDYESICIIDIFLELALIRWVVLHKTIELCQIKKKRDLLLITSSQSESSAIINVRY